ncbi:oligomeric, coiled-coil, peripheral membrane protein [Kappamyces sp. JEL0680]|nr:oligomeric, coiled-coil, peripheral membrane protein [Kappamyces sp. JEL0680]
MHLFQAETEQLVQSKALTIAIENLSVHAASTFESFGSFNTHAQKEFTKHASLLHSFPTDLNTLQQIPIHGSIVADNKKLEDYVPKDKLFAWVKRCQLSHDATRVEASVLDIRSSPSEPTKRLQAIDSLYSFHVQEYIPEITKLDRYVRETVIYFSDSKLHLSQVLQAKLQAISHFQSMIASVTPTITTLSNALNMQSEALLQLLHVHRMAPAWGATLVEIVRRKEYVRVFLQKAKEMADVLNQFRSQEQRRRETFKSEIFRYIPSGLINGLDDPPPFCEISVSNTKDTLPNLALEDISSFERLVSNIKTSQIASDPSNGSDSISKLQATMLKMTPQLELIGVDFEKILDKSGLTARSKRLEEENRRLRQLLPAKPTQTPDAYPAHESSTPKPLDSPAVSSSHYAKQEETIKAYEAKIIGLERVLQEKYHSREESASDPAQIKKLEGQLSDEQRKSKELRGQILKLTQENDSLALQLREHKDKAAQAETTAGELEELYKGLLEKHHVLEQQLADLGTNSSNQKQLLAEVSLHLNSCLVSLKSSEDSMIKINSIVIPNSIHADNLRQLMRKVEDDIISQMALLTNLKSSLNDSVGAASEDAHAQSVANELVGLMQRVNELEGHLRESESELTEAQAREAVMEAECSSIKKILAKTTESLEKHQERVAQLTAALEEEGLEKQALEERIAETAKEIAKKSQEIEFCRQELIVAQKKGAPDQGFPLQLHTLEAQLRIAREALEDWAIISRLSIEVISKHYADWISLQQLLGIPPSPDIFFQEVLSIDPENMSEDMEQFLPAITLLAKQTYDKISSVATLSSKSLALEVKSLVKQLRVDLGRRVTFQRY